MGSNSPWAFALLSGTVLLMVASSTESRSADDPSTITVKAWVKEQIDNRRLKVEFYDPAKPPQPYPGWTEFEFRMEYRCDYQLEQPRKKRKGEFGNPTAILPTFTRIDVPITHRMQLPKGLESDRWYEAVLARHELDHVRVGLHPRLVMLGKHLVKKVARIPISVERKEVTKEWISDKINAEIAPRRDAFKALVMGINRKIDTLTNHGAIPLQNREEFLAGLYLKENLDDMKFPYLTEVLDLIETREYRQAQVQIREIDVDVRP